MKTVSAALANRNFSALLKDVARGESVVITSRGKPVATMVPPALAQDDVKREQARQQFLAELKVGKALGPITWTRDELYER